MAMNQIQFQAGMWLPEFRTGLSPSTGRVRQKEILQRTTVVAAKFVELGDKLSARFKIAGSPKPQTRWISAYTTT